MRRFPGSPSYFNIVFAAELLLGIVLGKPMTALATGQRSLTAPAISSSAEGGNASLSQYQARLSSLDQLLAGCQDAMIPANCQSEQVGSDLRLALPTGVRTIRFAWVRDLLDRAAKQGAARQDAGKQGDKASSQPRTNSADSKSAGTQKQAPADAKKTGSSDPSDSEDSDEEAPVPAKPFAQFQEPTLAQQLVDARKRLGEEERAVSQLAAQQAGETKALPGPLNSVGAVSDSSAQRQILARILAAKEYHAAVVGPTLVDRALEKVGNWIDRVLGKLAEAGFKSRWIGYSAEIGFVLLLCIGLVWFFIRLEKQGRLGMANIRPGPGADAASARDWQLWLRDARSAAAQGAWRDAIHLLYWASISRLESSGQWPADRARTPREYLALLSPESAQRRELTNLTRSFERTWYAGRVAEESDFRAAEQVASKLGISPGAQ